MLRHHRWFPLPLASVAALMFSTLACGGKGADEGRAPSDSTVAATPSVSSSAAVAAESEQKEKVEGGAAKGGGESEGGGAYIARSGTWNDTRRGVRLILTFDETSNAFVGRVENTTQSIVCGVRVEVHLTSPKKELGPTARQNLPPGTSALINLPSDGAAFEKWTAHAESTAC